MPEHTAVLFANDAFYLAFANRDYDAMEAIWAREAPVTCIHPGWDALAERDEVMESWESILGNPTAINITCKNATVRVFGDWKIIHHQAGSAPPPEETEDEPPDTMQ